MTPIKNVTVTVSILKNGYVVTYPVVKEKVFASRTVSPLALKAAGVPQEILDKYVPKQDAAEESMAAATDRYSYIEYESNIVMSDDELLEIIRNSKNLLG